MRQQIPKSTHLVLSGWKDAMNGLPDDERQDSNDWATANFVAAVAMAQGSIIQRRRRVFMTLTLSQTAVNHSR
jgi:hypothetical protein